MVVSTNHHRKISVRFGHFVIGIFSIIVIFVELRRTRGAARTDHIPKIILL